MVLNRPKGRKATLLLASTYFLVSSSCYVHHQKDGAEEPVKLSVDKLLDTPNKFSGMTISVSGVLLWHGDEPTLFSDWESYESVNFDNSLQLQVPKGFVYTASEAHWATVVGVFYYDKQADGGKSTRVFRIRSVETGGQPEKR